MASIHFNDERAEIQPGKTIFEHADRTDAAIEQIVTSCGRNGSCKECVVEVRRGMERLSRRTEPESFLADRSLAADAGQFRLACQARVLEGEGDIHIETWKGTFQIVSEGTALAGEPELDPMVATDGQSVYYAGERIDRFRGGIFGVALDVGTTTVVMFLVNLQTGRTEALTAFENPQKYGGSDVMHRIGYDAGPAHAGRLHGSIVASVNKALREFPVSRQWIYELVVAGNATMRDVFFGLDVQSIGRSPYFSTTQHQMEAGERDSTAILTTPDALALNMNRTGRVYGIPLIHSHVGADTAAALAAVDLHHGDSLQMLMDIGTNTEIVLGRRGRVMAASCPAGPAFEGGGVKFGMPGIEGAIERVKIVDGRFACQKIGDLRPRGICGSGLVDILGELLRAGKMDVLGRFADQREEYAIDPENHITFGRGDMSELSQAKAAHVAGQVIILQRYGLVVDRIDRYILAGGFASHLDLDHAANIGLILPVPRERIVQIGNAAVEGARFILISQAVRRDIAQQVRRIEHVRLETDPDFFDIFVEGTQFKPIDPATIRRPGD